MSGDFLQSLQVFVRVAESGGFSRAADQLGIAASSVTASVQKLERTLGAPLFLRTTRRVRLTADGELLYERALGLLADAEEARTLFGQRGGARGRLRVEAPSRMVRRLLAPALPALLDAHPALELELNSNDHRTALVEAGIDCVIRVGAPAEASLVARPLGLLRIATCASPQLVERLGTPQTPDDLARYPAIHYGGLPIGRTEHWDLAGDAAVPMQGRLSVDNTESYIACACEGLGVIQAPAYDLREELHDGRLIELLPAFAPPPISVQALYPAHRRASSRLNAFMDWASPLIAAQAAF